MRSQHKKNKEYKILNLEFYLFVDEISGVVQQLKKYTKMTNVLRFVLLEFEEEKAAKSQMKI